jgi:hypothetical protein
MKGKSQEEVSPKSAIQCYLRNLRGGLKNRALLLHQSAKSEAFHLVKVTETIKEVS